MVGSFLSVGGSGKEGQKEGRGDVGGGEGRGRWRGGKGRGTGSGHANRFISPLANWQFP
jgi:hypothetical protein